MPATATAYCNKTSEVPTFQAACLFVVRSLVVLVIAVVIVGDIRSYTPRAAGSGSGTITRTRPGRMSAGIVAEMTVAVACWCRCRLLWLRAGMYAVRPRATCHWRAGSQRRLAASSRKLAQRRFCFCLLLMLRSTTNSQQTKEPRYSQLAWICDLIFENLKQLPQSTMGAPITITMHNEPQTSNSLKTNGRK